MSKKFQSNPPKTVLTITVGFLIIYIISHQQWALYLSVIMGLIGISSTYLSEKTEWIWMKIGWLLGLIMPKILLSALFYLILFPLAMLANLFQKDDLLRLKNKYNSTFKEVQKEFDASNFDSPW